MENTNETPFEEKKRTIAQNSALHLLFELLALELRKEGISMATVLQKFIIDTPATKFTVKELIWKPLQFAMTGKESTRELLKKEDIDLVYDALNKFTSENWGISIPFPSAEDVYHRQIK